MTIRIKCINCNTIVEHNPRQINGCNCDPDAPQWCYIETDGRIKGFSQAKWEVLENGQ